MVRAAAEVLNTACSLALMRVETADGRFLGHVFDLRCHWAPGQTRAPHIEEIIYGRSGLLERVGMVERRPSSVPWSAVKEIRDHTIVVDESKAPAKR